MNKNITVMTVFAALLFTTILSPVSAYAQNTATQMPSATTTPSATTLEVYTCHYILFSALPEAESRSCYIKA